VLLMVVRIQLRLISQKNGMKTLINRNERVRRRNAELVRFLQFVLETGVPPVTCKLRDPLRIPNR